MHRCYLPAADFSSPTLTLEGEEAHHALRVMRLRTGDECEVFDGTGHAARARILTSGGGRLMLGELRPLPPMLPVAEMTLALAIPKGGNMELIVQKAVELGVQRIIPLVTERTIVRLNAREAAAKTTKWQRTALEACKQCGVNTLPVVEVPQHYTEFIRRTDMPELKLVCAILPEAIPARKVLEEARSAGRQGTLLLIGPEGDFSPAEYASAMQHGFAPISLGPIILRVETAVFMALSFARYALDK